MLPTISAPFQLTAVELQHLIIPFSEPLPELRAAQQNLAVLQASPQMQIVLADTAHHMVSLNQIPQTTYTLFRTFQRTGDRNAYEVPAYEKRQKLSAAVLRMMVGQDEMKDTVQDYLWSICEESTWNTPACEGRLIDLWVPDTGLILAETILCVGDKIDPEVSQRVRQEIERRLFDPYLRYYFDCQWYQDSSNWNAVCNSLIGATFLSLEREPSRLGHALKIVLNGLKTYLDAGFAEDGSTSEGIGYWHYGFGAFTLFAEMLTARTHGAIDLLQLERVKIIAAYPAKMQLSGNVFAAFSDSDEVPQFNAGIVARIAERTDDKTLLNLLSPPVKLESHGLFSLLRFLLWWHGDQYSQSQAEDAVLTSGGLVRLGTKTQDRTPVIVAIKAGHNNEGHNHNDVGSFILHVDGENLLTDPGRPLYDRDYFSDSRYENIFANSYGHSVPRISGHLQSAGKEFFGELLEVETAGPIKHAVVQFARAYPIPELVSAVRRLSVTANGLMGGTVFLKDDFLFSDNTREIEEAFVTWHEVEIEGAIAIIHGQNYDLEMTIEEPPMLRFSLERLKARRYETADNSLLMRLSFTIPPAEEMQMRVRMKIARRLT